MFSLPIFIVPMSGIPEALARVIAPVSSMATSAEMVVEAVSKSVALVRSIDVTELFMAPSSVVSEKEVVVPPKRLVPQPVPVEATTNPMFNWYLAIVLPPPLPVSDEFAVAEAVMV